MAERKEAVRATCEEIQHILVTSHKILSLCAEPSNLKNEFPPECIQFRNLLGPVPSYLAGRLIESNCTRLKLEHKRVKDSEFEVWTGGISLWRTLEDDRDTGIKTLRHHLLLVVQPLTHPMPVLPW